MFTPFKILKYTRKNLKKNERSWGKLQRSVGSSLIIPDAPEFPLPSSSLEWRKGSNCVPTDINSCSYSRRALTFGNQLIVACDTTCDGATSAAPFFVVPFRSSNASEITSVAKWKSFGHHVAGCSVSRDVRNFQTATRRPLTSHLSRLF